MQAVTAETLATAICEFLSEMLRTRAVGLERASEIAAALLERLDAIRTEDEFLDTVEKLEFEFQELRPLKRHFQLHSRATDRERLEAVVRAFAAETLPRDPSLAVRVMEEALKEQATMDWMLRKYPQLNYFYERNQRRQPRPGLG